MIPHGRASARPPKTAKRLVETAVSHRRTGDVGPTGRKVMHLVDLDEYRRGPFMVDGERLPGSTRYMAPEEFVPGATIDERTSVLHLGRMVAELLVVSRWTAVQRNVVLTSTHAAADQRFSSVETMLTAWRSASAR